MTPARDRKFAAGRQPYDAYNGLRVGALAGALLGGVVTALSGVGVIWFIVGGAVLGGAIGYVVESRAVARDERHIDGPQ